MKRVCDLINKSFLSCMESKVQTSLGKQKVIIASLFKFYNESQDIDHQEMVASLIKDLYFKLFTSEGLTERVPDSLSLAFVLQLLGQTNDSHFKSIDFY